MRAASEIVADSKDRISERILNITLHHGSEVCVTPTGSELHNKRSSSACSCLPAEMLLIRLSAVMFMILIISEGRSSTLVSFQNHMFRFI